MDMKSSHLDGVAGQALVDPVFHVAAQRLVREPSQSIGQDNEQGEQPQQPQPTPAYRQHHGRLLSLDTQTSYLRAWRVPGDRNLKEALVASALPERDGSCDETPMSYVTRKELHSLGNLFIGARLPCSSSREFASGRVHVHIAIDGREACSPGAAMTRSASTSRSGGLIWGLNGGDLDLGLSTAEIKKRLKKSKAPTLRYTRVSSTRARLWSQTSRRGRRSPIRIAVS